MGHSLEEIARAIGARLITDSAGKAEITGIASIDSAGPNDIAFVESEKHLGSALQSRAGALIAGAFAEVIPANKPLLIVKHPKLAFVRTAELILPSPERNLGVHPTAQVHPSVRLGLGSSVGAFAAIEKNVTIGARSHIAAGVKIAADVHIGDECAIGPNVCIYSNTDIADRVLVHAGVVLGSDGFGFVRDPETGRYEKFPQVGSLRIEDNVEIGAGSTIDRGALDQTVIGSGTKLDNLVHVGHNVKIGKNVVIAALTGISGSCTIEDGAILGGQAGLAERATIGEGAILGGQAGVLPGKSVRGKGVIFWGTPAQPLTDHLKQLAVLRKLAKGAKSPKEE